MNESTDNNSNTSLPFPPPPLIALPLPPGWEEARDPSSGRIYFANRSTGETSWVRPALTSSQNINIASTGSIHAPSVSTFMQYGQSIPGNSFQFKNIHNPLFSSNSILPVPSVLGMLQEEQQMITTPSNVKLELDKLTGGKLSDLHNISLQQNPDREAYEPLDVASLPIDSRPPTIEPGRLEVRLASLYEALGRPVH